MQTHPRLRSVERQGEVQGGARQLAHGAPRVQRVGIHELQKRDGHRRLPEKIQAHGLAVCGGRPHRLAAVDDELGAACQGSPPGARGCLPGGDRRRLRREPRASAEEGLGPLHQPQRAGHQRQLQAALRLPRRGVLPGAAAGGRAAQAHRRLHKGAAPEPGGDGHGVLRPSPEHRQQVLDEGGGGRPEALGLALALPVVAGAAPLRRAVGLPVGCKLRQGRRRHRRRGCDEVVGRHGQAHAGAEPGHSHEPGMGRREGYFRRAQAGAAGAAGVAVLDPRGRGPLRGLLRVQPGVHAHEHPAGRRGRSHEVVCLQRCRLPWLCVPGASGAHG
mmetsp:Transcript_56973/g.144469  ORF Transcript_56973/g.144469 Transcript_56973/m.144469 type:complete len:331 (-) Transcript_56973:297-1289(-)